MYKRMGMISLIAAVFLFAGCVDTTTVVSVRKDGSGTITQTTFMDQTVINMFKGMAAQIGEEDDEEDAEKAIEDIKKYQEKALKMGTGVDFVSSREVTNEAGMEGVETIYSFEDIEEVNIDAQPENPMGDEMAGTMGAESSGDEDSDEEIVFEFKKGNPATLIIHMPQQEDGESRDEEEEDADEGSPAEAAQGMAMMKMFMQNFRIRVLINVLDAEMKETNASFVDKMQGKQTITLLDIPMGDILSNEKYADDFDQMSKIRDMGQAMEAMKKIPGLKIETQEKVIVKIK